MFWRSILKQRRTLCIAIHGHSKTYLGGHTSAESASGDGDSIQPREPATAMVSADEIGGNSMGYGANFAVLCAWMQCRLVSEHTNGEQ
jgi:hypothetical protein